MSEKNLLLLLPLLVLIVPSAPAQSDGNLLLERGREELRAGRTTQALDTWLEARSRGLEPDPRIGIAFLGTVAANRVHEQYEFATYLYDWGLSGRRVAPYRQALTQELELIRPLVDAQVYEEWQQLLEADNPRLLQEITLFWRYRDPTPFTGANERLLARHLPEGERDNGSGDAPQGENLLPLPVSVYQYRLIDESGNPYLATFFESRPQDAIRTDYKSRYVDAGAVPEGDDARTDRNLMNQYRLRKGFRVFDELGNLLNQQQRTARIVLLDSQATMLYLTLPHRSESITQIFSASLFNNGLSRSPESAAFYDPSLIGLALERISQPPLLDLEGESFLMGDPIPGFLLGEGAVASTAYPFAPANEGTIPSGSTLVLHMELYDMQGGPVGGGEVSVTLKITPAEDRIRWNDDLAERHTLQETLEAGEPRLIENLQIPTNRLVPGLYNLELVAEGADGHHINRSMQINLVPTF